MPLNCVKVSEEVAIMPYGAKSPEDVLQISRVVHVGHSFIMSNDGRIFMRIDGNDLNHANRYIQPATEEHRRAIRDRPMS